MKKTLLALGLATSVFALSACSDQITEAVEKANDEVVVSTCLWGYYKR